MVLAHVVFVFVFVGAHGVSSFAMFAARRETDRVRLAAILDLSTSSVNIAGLGLLVAVLIAMTPMAAGPMGGVRKALGMRVQGDKKDAPLREPGD